MVTDMTTNSCPICNDREPEFQALTEALERLKTMECSVYYLDGDWRVYPMGDWRTYPMGVYGVSRGDTFLTAINAAWEVWQANRSEE